MDLKKIDVPNKLFEYRNKLKKEHDIVGDFKRFDIVYIERDNYEPYIGIIADTFNYGYKVNYINENGQYCTNSFTARANAEITLVERQNPTNEFDLLKGK